MLQNKGFEFPLPYNLPTEIVTTGSLGEKNWSVSDIDFIYKDKKPRYYLWL